MMIWHLVQPLLLLLLFLFDSNFLSQGVAHAFVPMSRKISHTNVNRHACVLASSNNNNNNEETATATTTTSQNQQDRLTKLGFTGEEIDRSTKSSPSPFSPQKVSVTEVEVDPVTLTALGFGLIAINFLIFANMGSGGIAGILATIINTWGQ